MAWKAPHAHRKELPMKKRPLSFLILWLFCLILLAGCQEQAAPDASSGAPDIDPATAVLDFNRYYLKDMGLFLGDYGLAMEDFTPTSPYNYDTKQPLPFLNTEATYQLCCGEENEIILINLWFETTAQPSADFEQIRYIRDYFNGLKDSLFLNDLEEFGSKGPNLNTYQTPEELEAAVQEYADTPREDRTNYVFSLTGYWNLQEDVQVWGEYRMSPEAGRGMLYFVIRNSKAGYAMQRDGTLVVPEGMSLFPQSPSESGAGSEEGSSSGPRDSSQGSSDSPGEASKDSSEATPSAFHWSVPADAFKQTPGFSAKAGSRISVSLSVTPEDASIKVGVVDSAGEREYITGEGAISNVFSVKEDGTYHIFIENQGSGSIEIEGLYNIR